MKNWTRTTALLALCGAFGPSWAEPAAVAALPMRQIVIDAETGRARMPTHEEVAAAAERRAAAGVAASARRAPAAASPLGGHPVVQHLQARPVAATQGASAMRVPASRLSYTVLRRGSDGRIATVCVGGEDAATHAQHSPAAREHDHAQ